MKSANDLISGMSGFRKRSRKLRKRTGRGRPITDMRVSGQLLYLPAMKTELFLWISMQQLPRTSLK